MTFFRAALSFDLAVVGDFLAAAAATAAARWLGSSVHIRLPVAVNTSSRMNVLSKFSCSFSSSFSRFRRRVDLGSFPAPSSGCGDSGTGSGVDSAAFSTTAAVELDTAESSPVDAGSLVRPNRCCRIESILLGSLSRSIRLVIIPPSWPISSSVVPSDAAGAVFSVIFGAFVESTVFSLDSVTFVVGAVAGVSESDSDDDVVVGNEYFRRVCRTFVFPLDWLALDLFTGLAVGWFFVGLATVLTALSLDSFAVVGFAVGFVVGLGCDGESDRFSFGILNCDFLEPVSPPSDRNALQSCPLNALSKWDFGSGGAAADFAFASFFVDSRRLAIGAGFGATVDVVAGAAGGFMVVGLEAGCVVVVTSAVSCVDVATVAAGVAGGAGVVELTLSRLFSNSRSRL